jgi:hypothetical protein
MSDVTDRSTRQLDVAPTYWGRFQKRLPWAVAVCAPIGLVHGLTAGGSGTAVITYTVSAMATQAFVAAPLITLLLAAFPSKRPAPKSETPDLS